MSSSEEDEIEIVDETDEKTTTIADSMEPFVADDYVAKIIELLDSSDKDAPERIKYFVAQTWARPADSANFVSAPISLDSGGVSKLPANMMMAGGKRIAGTQRLMYAPNPTMKRNLVDAGPAQPKKIKKQMPVIDDSIYCSTDQPCTSCGGVSQAGNQVLSCKRCRDCFHMKCSQPPVSTEEASDPKFIYHCKTCLISKKIRLDSSRSRSPSPAIKKVSSKDKLVKN